MIASDRHKQSYDDEAGDDPTDNVPEPAQAPQTDKQTDSMGDRDSARQGVAPAEGSGARLTSRSIRSFVIRNGRMTDAQTDAMTRLMPTLGIDFHSSDGAKPLQQSFDHPERPLWLEIGFGNGDALLGMAESNPQVNLVGVEVHAPGVGHALLGVESRGLENVRLVRHDALDVLEKLCATASLARVMLFFPDPWHKKRHHKRRIVRPDFLNAVAHALTPGGLLHCATDVTDYATWMHEHLAADNRFANTAAGCEDVVRPDWRPATRFERRGERLGHAVHDLLYRRC